MGFEQGGYYSELPYARKVAEHVGANYHEVVIGQKEFLEMLPDLVYHSDEPLADLAAVPLLVAGMAVSTFGGTVYNVNQVSLRQAITPTRN